MKAVFLRLLIRGAGKTQAQVAKEAGITEKHLSRLCSGATGRGMSAFTARKIGDVLGLPEEIIYIGVYLETLAREDGFYERDRDPDDPADLLAAGSD